MRCSYQFTKTHIGEASSKEVLVCQAFVMIGLGTILQLRKYYGQVFHSVAFQHNTAVPIIISNRNVHYLEHEHVDMVAWDGGDNNKKTSNQLALEKREES